MANIARIERVIGLSQLTGQTFYPAQTFKTSANPSILCVPETRNSRKINLAQF
jgi:hypothetical protein